MAKITNLNNPILRRPSEQLSISNNEILELQELSQNYEAKRCRICIHQKDTDTVHQMIINLQHDSYVAPARHVDKEETLIFLSGTGAIIFFSNSGSIEKIEKCSSLEPDHARLLFIPRYSFHAVLPLTQSITFVETTTGPFNNKFTENAAWAPPPEEKIEGLKFLRRIYEHHVC